MKAMSTRDWKREVHQNLAEEARREASIFWNSRLARQYIRRGVGVALVVVLTYSASTAPGLGAGLRQMFLTISLFGGMIAASLMLIGVIGLAFRHGDDCEQECPGEPPPIGW
jgi:hypothetical protein